MGMFIAIVAIMAGVSIPLTAILTSANTTQQKLKIKMLEKEAELERLRLETYTAETEKMRLELEHSKVLLLEEKAKQS
ncbi:hypothetical protein [Lysinibacillus piscis]|uniref:Flagellar cap protein n=1 Tax=Lysinibacillus piscis TaxID=2518931 RepID=A0ABQ5NGA3_9BACI|nr:hypothetical protein [Lysinibacillus sp. KH24]GLC87066.1 hypothetical protein LYSBPC_01930 [Lysinibacillus sp. KH24]